MQTDHLGNHFKSVSAMTRHYGIPRPTYISRLKSGWTVKEALTVPVLKDGSNYKTSNSLGGIVDHLGNHFSNNAQMARHWGISPSLLHRRVHDKGMSLEDALTTPISRKHSAQEVTDHLGNKYCSRSLMAKAYGISSLTLGDRLKRGWSMEEALTTPIDTSSYRKTKRVAKVRVQDHLGDWYDSYYELAKAYGLSFSTLYGRVAKLGWSIEKALLTPTQERKTGTRKRGIA